MCSLAFKQLHADYAEAKQKEAEESANVGKVGQRAQQRANLAV